MKLHILAVFILILSANILAQSPGKILGQANKAMGGEKALKAVKSWQLNGTIKRLSDGQSGKYSSYASNGNLYGETFDLNGFEFATGYNGKSG